MPRRTKASPEDKVQIVEAYLRGEIGKSAAAKLSVVLQTKVNRKTKKVPQSLRDRKWA